MSREYDLNLKKFDITSLESDSVICYIGRRRTGKSVCVKDVMYTHRDIPFGNIISATEEANQFYGDFIPKTYIYHEYDTQIVNNIIKRQKEMIKKEKSGNPIYKNIDNRLFLILDDCLYDDSWTRDKAIRGLFMNGRHWKVMFMITMQYPLGIPPALRTNIDYTFIMREPYLSNRKRIYENYAGTFPDFNMFCQVMNSLGEFECLVIKNNSKSNKLEEQVYWYKANIHGPFKCGSQAYWKYHNENYKDIENEKQNFDISRYKMRGNKNLVNIKKHGI